MRFETSIPTIATPVEEDDLKLTQGSNLVDLAAIPPFDVWGEAVRARRVQGERLTLAIVELAPNAVVPEHRHDNEQLGMVIVGNVRFTIDGETRDLGPGGTWRILSNRPHTVSVGPEGATVIDVFAPVREDWDRFEPLPPRQPNWP
jgi:quercetin dioxygenase-like cupin family protein